MFLPLPGHFCSLMEWIVEFIHSYVIGFNKYIYFERSILCLCCFSPCLAARDEKISKTDFK